MAKKDQGEENALAWLDQYTDSLWFKILFDDDKLKLDKNFILHIREKEKPYMDYVNERLLAAAQSMKSLLGEMAGINQLLHTASSIILIEGERDRIDITLNYIRNSPVFRDIDPTVILTSVSLYFLIRNAEYNLENSDSLKELKYIHNRLDQMNWLIWDSGVEALNILRMEECFHD